jgi:hypothetical protein
VIQVATKLPLGAVATSAIQPIKNGKVTSVTITADPPVTHGSCETIKQYTTFTVLITVTGPLDMVYTVPVMFNGNVQIERSYPPAYTFSSTSSTYSYPSTFASTNGCGTYTMGYEITSPNVISGYATWTAEP